MFRYVKTFPLFFVAATLLLGVCAAPPQPRFFWPLPPLTPRLEFKGAYYSEGQIPKKGWGKLSAEVMGVNPETAFEAPYDVASSGDGVVYVTDIIASNVRVFDFNKRKVTLLSKVPIPTPYGLSLDGQGNLYVASPKARAILVYSPQGEMLRSIGGDGALVKPVRVALNERLGRLYVSDVERHQLKIFDLAEGRLLKTIGKRGVEAGEFNEPGGIAVGSDDRVFVLDVLGARVQVFDAEGNFLAQFGERGDSPTTFERPKDLAIDSEGHLFITDVKKGAILVFSSEGDPLLFLGAGQPSRRDLAFALPTGVWVDPEGAIYVADLINRRFVIWQLLTPAYLAKEPIGPDDIRRQEEFLRIQAEKAKK